MSLLTTKLKVTSTDIWYIYPAISSVESTVLHFLFMLNTPTKTKFVLGGTSSAVHQAAAHVTRSAAGTGTFVSPRESFARW